MSNLEKSPHEIVIGEVDAGHGEPPHPPVDDSANAIAILPPRAVPLGGPRAMTVRRTLPSRERSMIGAWCFVDHYGPTDVRERDGMLVPPHPHTGLQTVSWLFEGEIEHRDSVGSHALIRPGVLNLMTAGRGISHSEVSTPATSVLHGVQLWVALPDASRNVSPFFESHAARVARIGAATVRVFIGALDGIEASATAFTRLLAAQVDVPANARIELPVDPHDEHGVLVDEGGVMIDGIPVARTELAYAGPGASRLVVETGDDPARLLLLGGEPFGEQIVMWWNFVGRSHEEIVEYREAWQAEAVGAGRVPDEPRFESVHGGHGYEGAPLPAPELPTVRLLPRQR